MREFQDNLQLPIYIPVSGEIVATQVDADAFLQHYTDSHHEWVQGFVIKMAPVSSRHDDLAIFLRKLLDAYLEEKPIAVVKNAPFVMRLADSFREPDLQVILNTNLGGLTDTAMLGSADICIEIVSRESATRDYGAKRIEYEQAGVTEYWLIDPIRQLAEFYRLVEGRYQSQQLDANHIYQTPLLPQFKLTLPLLWQENLPTHRMITKLIEEMFA
jgi:Uma2 family endonuclease